MSTFRLEPNDVIYLYHWINPKQPFKLSTGLRIDAKKWNKEKSRARSANSVYNGKNINSELSRIDGAFHVAWNYFQANGGFSPIKLRTKIKELLSAEPGSISTSNNLRFLDFFSKQVEEYKASGTSSWKGYQTTLEHLKKYFGREIPTFEDIDSSFYINFNKYLIGKELSTNTISGHWKFIKVIMKHARLLKYHNSTDYQSFKRSQEDSDTVFLTLDELDKIYKLKLTGYLEKARDYFIIGCYTGLRYSDWDRVSLAKIKNDVLALRSTKTGEPSIIRIHPKVLKTLKKYPDGVLPPKPSSQNLNVYLKKVVQRAGIDEPTEKRITKGGIKTIETVPKYNRVATHTARRSFATNMVLTGASPYLIMVVTGHKSIISFEKYVRFNELQATDKLKDSAFFNQTEIEDEEVVTKLTNEEKKKLLLLP